MNKPTSFFLAALKVNLKDVRGVLDTLRQADSSGRAAGLRRRAESLRSHKLVNAAEREAGRVARRAPR